VEEDPHPGTLRDANVGSLLSMNTVTVIGWPLEKMSRVSYF